MHRQPADILRRTGNRIGGHHKNLVLCKRQNGAVFPYTCANQYFFPCCLNLFQHGPLQYVLRYFANLHALSLPVPGVFSDYCPNACDSCSVLRLLSRCRISRRRRCLCRHLRQELTAQSHISRLQGSRHTLYIVNIVGGDCCLNQVSSDRI